jgi:hypothetical protein
MCLIRCHMSSLRSVRKRGRPTTRQKALNRDMDASQLDDMDARPGYHKKTPIRHPVHLNGMIYHFCVKPNHEVVWKMNFLDAPGGRPQRYEMNKKGDVVAAIDERSLQGMVSPELFDSSAKTKTANIVAKQTMLLSSAACRYCLVGMIQNSLRVCHRSQGICLR